MIHTQTIEQYKIAKYIEGQFFDGSVTLTLLSRDCILVKDKNGDALEFFLEGDEVKTREPAAKSPDILEAEEAEREHRKAFEEWQEGDIQEIWRDDSGILCVRYRSGNWWHYKKTASGLEWW